MTDEIKTIDDLIAIYNENPRRENKGAEIRSAYRFAFEKHNGRIRENGEPYTRHLLRVAGQVAGWGFQSDVIVSALLHDTIERCGTPLTEIQSRFGKDVADIVGTVSTLSDTYFRNPSAAPPSSVSFSDERQKKITEGRALYIKTADRIDNFRNLFGGDKKRLILKAEHTRQVILPEIRKNEAWQLADKLEDLCFKAMQPQKYEIISEYLEANTRRYRKMLDLLRHIFDIHFNQAPSDVKYIVRFTDNYRSASDICRQLEAACGNDEDLPAARIRDLLVKNNLAICDLNLVVIDNPGRKDPGIRPNDIFFHYFEYVLSNRLFYLLDFEHTALPEDAGYFLLADRFDNMYRFFVRTETQYRHFQYGNIIDMDSEIIDVGKYNPPGGQKEKITVYKKDGSSKLIDRGATVLDFAFAIHRDVGYHFAYALINNSKIRRGPGFRLNPLSKITIVKDDKAKPSITWFRYAKTDKAVNDLIAYFSKKLQDQ